MLGNNDYQTILLKKKKQAKSDKTKLNFVQLNQRNDKNIQESKRKNFQRQLFSHLSNCYREYYA